MNQHEIAKNTILNAIRTMATITFPLITLPYISRVLGVENLGKVNFSNSIVRYFSLLGSLGISTYAIRECSYVKDDREKMEKIASEIFSLNILTMLISYILLGCLLWILPSMHDYRLLICILSMSMILNILGIDWVNIAREDFTYITLRTLAFQILSIVLVFLFVKNSTDYVMYAIVSVVSGSGANIANIVYARKFCRVRFTFKIDIRKHLRPVLLLFSLLIAQTIMSNLDITMIGVLLGDFQVGLYSMSVKLYITVEQVVSSIAFVLLPGMSKLFYEKNYFAINSTLKRAWVFIYSLAVPATVGLIGISNEILLLLCGSEYSGATASLCILSLSMFVNLLGGSFWGNIVLLPSKREGKLMVACVMGALANIVLNFVLIKTVGINGAAIATVISNMIIYVLCRVKKDKGIRLELTIADIVGPIIGGAIVMFVCIISKVIFANLIIRIVFCILLSVLLYYVVLFLFRNELVIIVNERVKHIMRRKGNE